MVFTELLGSVWSLVKVRNTVDIDTATAKLHYKITSSILISFCLLVTANGLVGTPINCIHDKYLDKAVVNTFCWIHTTFTLPKYHKDPLNDGLHPGIGPMSAEDERVYHSYYQWVPFMLFIQGILFYVPHWLWKAWEGQRLEAMCMGLTVPIIGKEDRTDKITLLVDYLCSSLNAHNFYAFKFLFCELLYVMNVILNMWLVDAFLGGVFLSFGVDVVRFLQDPQEIRTDPLIKAFPRVTKCTFHMFGPSGTVQRHDLMCVLALNAVNEKIYVFLWFWFVVVACISGLAFLYRLLVMLMPSVRTGLLYKKSKVKEKEEMEASLKHLQIGDFFTLYLLSKNLDLLSFNQLMHELCVQLDARRFVHPDIEMSLPHSQERFRLVNQQV